MKTTKIFSMVIVLLLIFTFSVTSISAFAEESQEQSTVSAETQNVIDLASALPGEKTITLDNKDQIVAAKKAYDELQKADRAKVGAANIAKINVAFETVSPYILGNVVERLEALPKKIKEKNKDEIIEIYNDYILLSSDAQNSLEPALKSKMLDAIKLYSPELLVTTDENVSSEVSSETDETSTEAVSGISFEKIYEKLIISVLGCLILANVVLVVVVIIKMQKYKKHFSNN